MSDLLSKAENYERKAKKKLNFFGTEYDEAPVPDFLVAELSKGGLYGPKFDDAADLFKKAAICYKLAMSWDKAGSTYIRLANCHLKMERKREAALSYHDAGNCYKETSTKEAITCIEQAVNLFCDIGRPNMAARYLKEIAELYESEQNIEKAISYFEKAVDFFQNEKLTTSANECKLKVAQFSAQLEQYPSAIEIYEEIARHSLENYKERERHSLAWHSLKNDWLEYESSIKGHLLNAGLCQLCKGDPVAITKSLERYRDLYPTFSGTRECQFLADIATTIDEEDVSKFTDIVKEFDSTTTLDPWKTTFLLRVKDKLKAKTLKRTILLESTQIRQACTVELARRPARPGLGIVAMWNEPGLGTVASRAIQASWNVIRPVTWLINRVLLIRFVLIILNKSK